MVSVINTPDQKLAAAILSRELYRLVTSNGLIWKTLSVRLKTDMFDMAKEEEGEGKE
jgi:hypothetical protein